MRKTPESEFIGILQKKNFTNLFVVHFKQDEFSYTLYYYYFVNFIGGRIHLALNQFFIS